MLGLDFLACCVFAYWLVRHPDAIVEAIQEWGYARRGEESPAAKARAQRLADAGVDPAPGGGFSRYAGNVWRDFWNDQDTKRARRRAEKSDRTPRTAGRAPNGPAGGGWWERAGLAAGRFADRVVDRQAAKWSRRQADGGSPGQSRPDAPPNGNPSERGRRPRPDTPPIWPDPGPAVTDPVEDRQPIRVQATVGRPDPQEAPVGYGCRYCDYTFDLANPDKAALIRGNHEDTCTANPYNQPKPSITHRPGETGGHTSPLAKASTSTATAVLDPGGETMSNLATRGTAVTGVVSGAAEARSIQRALENATAQYDAAVASAQKRIHQLGEAAMGVVQLAGKSDVVQGAAQAAEAIAAAKNSVNTCKAEVIPILGVIARRFDAKAN